MRDLRDVEIDAFLSQADHLATLLTHPAWAGWTGLLRDMRASALEQLVIEKDAGEIRYWQGVAATLGELLERPTRVIQAAADYQTTEESEQHVIRPDLRAALGFGVDRESDI